MKFDVKGQDDSAQPTDGQGKVQKWLREIGQALKREKEFRKEGERITKIYEAEKKEEYQFNILYSNTETLAPAVYNSTPRPEVKRRFNDADPLGLMACNVTQRVLAFLLDSNDPNYPEFDSLLQSAVHEALLPGRGVTAFTYEAEFESVAGDSDLDEASERVSYETVCGKAIPWDRFLHGYAKKWEDVPWIAYEYQMDRKELESNFGAEIAAKCQMTKVADDAEAAEGSWASRNSDAQGEELCCVYQIWDKDTRTVLSISPGCPDMPLKEVADPLGLTGFFNCPRPLMFFRRVSSLVPKALYEMYEEQAKELNAVTVRINKVVRALKVRGFYDSTLEGLDKLLTSEDNTLLPAENVAAMMQGQTLDRAIWLMPIEKLVAVLQQLYNQRMQVKQTIYEITGIADIMRGSSQASETLGAQEIKNQWGTLRLKRAQKEVARYARDCLRIMTEIAVKKLQPATIKAMAEAPLPLEAEKQQAQAVMMQSQSIGQQPSPEVLQTLQQPSIEQVLALMQNDSARHFRIDIETNSTVDLEATEDKQDISEFLNAMAQFLNGVAPLIESGAMQFDAAKAILMGIVRKFRFGTEVENQINAMQPPKPPQQDDGKAQAETAALQAEVQVKQQEAQLRMQEMQLDFQLKQAEHAFKMQELERKAQLSMKQFALRMQQNQEAPAKPAGITKP